MKLLYITNGITNSGGLERVLSVKASYFAEVYGFEVHIITLNEAGKSPFYHFSPKIQLHSIVIQSIKDYLTQYFTQINYIVSEIKPDVISVCDDGVKGLLIPLWLKKNYKAIIYERHVSRLVQQDSERISLKERMLFKLMRFGAKKYDRFIVLTQGNIAEWHGLDNIEVIPNPLPFNPSVISTCENKRVITVGRFVYQKGYDYLVDVWKQINNLHPDWHLVIYGTGPDEELIKRLILQKEVKNISIHPPVKDIAAEYSASSIYVLTSRFEGFGMVLIEAMSCGLPCVSFDCPCGPSDIITDGTEGFLIPSYDIKTFVSKLSELMSDNHLRRGMGRQGRQNIDRYKPEQICNQWRLLFNQLITEEKKR